MNKYRMKKRQLIPQRKDSHLIPLHLLKEGESGVVHSIDGGYRVNQRMLDLGFVHGEKIHVSRSLGYGPIIVEVKGTKIAIGRGISKKVLIKKI